MAGGLKLFDYRMTEKEHILAETIIEMTDKSELFRTGLEHFDWSEIKVIPTGDRPHDFSYTLKQEAWIELIDAVAAYIKLNPSGEWLSSDSRTYYKENGFRYTDSQKKKFLKTVSGGLTDYMSDWWEWTKDGRPENPRLDEMGWHEEALGRNAVVGGFQGQRQWTDWLPNADFTEAIMASTFDWNGPKAPTPFATENDTCNGIAMMLGSLVSGSAPCFHDVRTYWSPEACERVTGQKPDGVAANGFIHLINSGATALDGSGACVDAKGNHVMKPFWKMTDADIKACLNATDWCRADYEYFRGGGYSSHFRCKAEMPVTMLRFNIVEGIGPVLQIAEGWTADLPDEIHNTIDKRTDPTWPTTWFCPRLTGQGAFTDVYSVMANWGANHGVTVYGHVGADLITLASMLRIPVTMHNVPAEKIYRPHAWASFGTQDQQAADYAACKQYGPLYR